MDVSSLDVYVLLHLMKFVKPVDRINVLLSGIVKGFENVCEGFNLRKRVEYCEIELGLRRDSTCELEIRSLELERVPDESFREILERLAVGGFLQNNRQFIVHVHWRLEGAEFHWARSSRFIEVICSMKNLESLHLLDHAWSSSHELSMKPEDLALVFQSCSKITDLRITTTEDGMSKMTEHVKNQLRSSFQKLRYFGFRCFIDNESWLVIQEMLTWLKECVQLAIINYNLDRITIKDEIASLAIGNSLALDSNLAESMQFLYLKEVPDALVKWILPVCLNIHYLQINIFYLPYGLHYEIARLKKLKELDVRTAGGSELKEIVRSCRQVEKLRMDLICLKEEYLGGLQLAENITDLTFNWERGLPLKEVLPELVRWRQLRRLAFTDLPKYGSDPTFEGLEFFLMMMKNLSYLHIVPDRRDEGQLKILRDKVKKFILPQRPNFTFDISDD